MEEIDIKKIKVPEEFRCVCWNCEYDEYGNYEECVERKRRYLKEERSDV